ncbi:hypothetical protein ACFGZ1_11205 [Pasteurella multocida]
MKKITLAYIALALKKQYVPAKVILKWIEDYRIQLLINQCYQSKQFLILRDLEKQTLRLIQKQKRKKMLEIFRKEDMRRNEYFKRKMARNNN